MSPKSIAALLVTVLATASCGEGDSPHSLTAPAVSPVGSPGASVVAVVFGEAAVLSTSDGGNGGLLVTQQAPLAQAATLQSLSFYVTSASGKLRLGVYDATGPSGGPGAKKAETAEITPVSGWNTAAVTAPVALAAGTYWLAYLSNTNTLQFRMATNGSGKWYAVTYGVLPAVYATAPSRGAYHWSFYGTLTSGGTTNAAPTVATVAAASPSPATGTTAVLSVLGADDGGEAALTYTWAATGSPPAAVTFGTNGTNAAKASTATFSKAGGYTLQATVTDAQGLTATNSVAVTVNQTLTTIVVTPAGATVAPSGTQPYAAAVLDQFAQPLTVTPAVTWAVNGGGAIAAGGLFTAGSAVGGPFTVMASSGGKNGVATVTVGSVSNAPPTVAAAAAASPSPVAGTTTALSVQSADDGGEAALTYTWATTASPPAAVVFAPNGTNAAKASTATFTRAGNYTLRATTTDAQGLTVTSSVSVTVSQSLTSIVVAPASATVAAGGTQPFAATARDQFAQSLTVAPAFAWTGNGGGTISAGGLFTAGATAGGPFAVTASSGGKNGTASVTVSAGSNTAPTVATGAAASPSPVNGTTTALSVLGADNGGEAALTYTWATTGSPPAAVSFAPNGTNAAKASTATFTQTGTYALRATLTDAQGLTITSSATVVVSIPSQGAVTGLDFPGVAGVTRTMRFKFDAPQNNGLPAYGPGGSGVTYIWRAYPRQQNGYYTAFFWGNDDGRGTINATFLWKNGSADTYYGAHPYPHGGHFGAAHDWEIPVEQDDYVNGAVVYNRWYTQALRVWSDAGGKHHEFYWDLPNTDAAHMVSRTSPTSYGNVNPPSPALTWGDAPWNPGQEVWDGVLRGIQIYSGLLSLNDIMSETGAPLSTAAGANSIWYLNVNPTPSDISDKSGRGHNPLWIGTERPALYSN